MTGEQRDLLGNLAKVVGGECADAIHDLIEENARQERALKERTAIRSLSSEHKAILDKLATNKMIVTWEACAVHAALVSIGQLETKLAEMEHQRSAEIKFYADQLLGLLHTWTEIREKQAAKPKGSPLPEAVEVDPAAARRFSYQHMGERYWGVYWTSRDRHVFEQGSYGPGLPDERVYVKQEWPDGKPEPPTPIA